MAAMRIMVINGFISLILSFSILSDVNADSFRCGRKLVKTGDSSIDLLRICGKPRYKDRGYEKIKVDGVTRSERVERWYYKKSSRSLERQVLLYRGRIAAIEIGSR